MVARKAVVEMLVQGAAEGMQETCVALNRKLDLPVNGSEVNSAFMTLVKRAIKGAIEKGADPAHFRQPLEEIYSLVADKQVN